MKSWVPAITGSAAGSSCSPVLEPANVSSFCSLLLLFCHCCTTTVGPQARWQPLVPTAAAVLAQQQPVCKPAVAACLAKSWRSGLFRQLHPSTLCFSLSSAMLALPSSTPGTIAAVGGSSSGPGAAAAGLQSSSGGMSRKKLAIRASPSQPSLGKLATTLGAGATGATGTNGVSAAASEVEPA